MAILARNIKKLPKWAIKQAGGINKKAWRLARGKRRKSVARKRKAPKRRRRLPGRVMGGAPRKKGIIAKINAGLRGLKLALPAIGSAMAHGLNADSPNDILWRYSGFRLKDRAFDLEKVKTSVGFYAGNVVEAKAMSLMKIPQMAGRKKLLSIAAQYLPEISAVPEVIAGNYPAAVNQLSRASVGYEATSHLSWLENPTIRDEWLKSLGGRIGLGLFSRFLGPMINKHLPKGINL